MNLNPNSNSKAGAASSGKHFLLLDATPRANGYDPLRDLLAGKWKAGDILSDIVPPTHTRSGYIRAGILARMFLQSHRRVLLVDPEDPASPTTTRLYDRAWLGGHKPFRVPCANWRLCQNPEGPCTAYRYEPSGAKDKNPGGTEHLCLYCRRVLGPSPYSREQTAQRNRARAGQPRKPRGPRKVAPRLVAFDPASGKVVALPRAEAKAEAKAGTKA